MIIGIIGGSGLENSELIKKFEEIEVETPFGKTSSPILSGKIHGIDVLILSRHGKKHEITPTNVNNKANIYALKKRNCTHIIATTAVGSLREEIGRGDLVLLDQFIDFTRNRCVTFYDKFDSKEGPQHTQMSSPFSKELREKAIESCKDLKLKYHPKGTVITIEGPRFSTIAESKMFRQWGADVINMSTSPEAILAKEAEIEYMAIAMSTDYDCWKQDEEPVSWEQILKVFKENVNNVRKLISRIIELYSEKEKQEYIKDKIRTVPNFPKQGIIFRDITTILNDSEGMNKIMEIFEGRYKNKNIEIVAGIESRGFIIGAILANRLNVGFVPIRKSGKLPSETISQEYLLEYGKDSIEIHKDAIKQNQRVLIIDDLLATGGTAQAAGNLIEKLGGEIAEIACVIELADLKGREKISRWQFFSIVKFEGE